MLNQTRWDRATNQLSRPLVIAALTITALGAAGCPGGGSKTSDSNIASATPSPTSASTPSGFDGERALEHVKKQVDFGPRPAGSAELEKSRGYILDQLKSYALKVTTDEFRPVTPVGERKMVNITAEIPGESSDVIIISSHYDTKPIKAFKFVGANDGGASTGALMELARVMAANKQKPRFTYWFVFFDGEEAFCFDWDECKNPNPANPAEKLPDNTYGSRHFVDQLKANNEVKRVRAMILFDMMGYKNLRLGRDDMSTHWLLDIVWQTAKQQGYGAQFVDATEGVGGDDHEPFLRADIDSLDIIQLSTYKSPSGEEYWHTKEDTLDKVSAKSLKTVGDVILASLPKIEEHLANKRQ